MPDPAPSVPYASPMPGGSPIWRLFRLGLILWASITLLRHSLYWSNLAIGGSLFSGGGAVRGAAFAAVECVLLVLFLLAAVNSPRPTHQRFAVLGGLGAAFVGIVLIGATIDLLSIAWGGVALNLRGAWAFVSKLQVAVFPTLCLIGFLTRSRRE